MKVLVADDSRAMRAYVKGSLAAHFKCAVYEAASGFEALRLLPRNKYDVVIADINMPDINGLELIGFVRKSPAHKLVPIIIISTQNTSRDKERALDLGASYFLSKPFQPEDLAAVINKYLPARGSNS